MAITKRNYIPGDYESITNEPIGVTPVLNTWYTFKLDGLFNFTLADVQLYQGAVLVPSSAYDLRTDSTYTTREASFSGKTLYNQFRITNATYAGIATLVTASNFVIAIYYSLHVTLMLQL